MLAGYFAISDPGNASAYRALRSIAANDLGEIGRCSGGAIRQERARRMALVAYRHALRSGCPLAQGRAGTLVDRLVARSRVARGSAGPR